MKWTTTRLDLSLSLGGVNTPGVRHEDILVTPLRRDCKERHVYALFSNQLAARVCTGIDLL